MGRGAEPVPERLRPRLGVHAPRRRPGPHGARIQAQCLVQGSVGPHDALSSLCTVFEILVGEPLLLSGPPSWYPASSSMGVCTDMPREIARRDDSRQPTDIK